MASGFLSWLQERNCTPSGLENHSVRAKCLPTDPEDKGVRWRAKITRSPFFLWIVKRNTVSWSGCKKRYDHKIPVPSLPRWVSKIGRDGFGWVRKFTGEWGLTWETWQEKKWWFLYIGYMPPVSFVGCDILVPLFWCLYKQDDKPKVQRCVVTPSVYSANKCRAQMGSPILLSSKHHNHALNMFYWHIGGWGWQGVKYCGIAYRAGIQKRTMPRDDR